MAGPLDGIRILDTSAVVSGPLAATLLADQGALVLKIEPPGRGDVLRWVGRHRRASVLRPPTSASTPTRC